MFHYSCIGCDYHCSITVEEKNGEITVSKNGCPTGLNFAVNEFKKTLKTGKNSQITKKSKKKKP